MGRTACTEPQYSYTSTPPMGRTACTEPQCLYKGALYLLPYQYMLQRTDATMNEVLEPITFFLAYPHRISFLYRHYVPFIVQGIPNNRIRGEHKVFPRLQICITRKLRGIQIHFFFKM